MSVPVTIPKAASTSAPPSIEPRFFTRALKDCGYLSIAEPFESGMPKELRPGRVEELLRTLADSCLGAARQVRESPSAALR